MPLHIKRMELLKTTTIPIELRVAVVTIIQFLFHISPGISFGREIVLFFLGFDR